ncbi:hypothetical protein A2U01_0113193, partial [Trifolium medium]|nr:hypothetical protein [Trifolium medium]
MARRARTEHETWNASGNCVSRRQGWRVAPASAEEIGELLS